LKAERRSTEKLAAEMLAVLLKSAELRASVPIKSKSARWIASIVNLMVISNWPVDLGYRNKVKAWSLKER
jgi:hypothetical protein